MAFIQIKVENAPISRVGYIRLDFGTSIEITDGMVFSVFDGPHTVSYMMNEYKTSFDRVKTEADADFNVILKQNELMLITIRIGTDLSIIHPTYEIRSLQDAESRQLQIAADRGVQQRDRQSHDEYQGKKKEADRIKIIYLILCVCLGYFGVHHFYIGNKKKGILYLCTFGIVVYGVLYDFWYGLTHDIELLRS